MKPRLRSHRQCYHDAEKNADDIQQLEDRLLRLGSFELETERALNSLQAHIRDLSAVGDDAAAHEASLRHTRMKNDLMALRERIYRLETQLYGARRRQRQ